MHVAVQFPHERTALDTRLHGIDTDDAVNST